MPATHRWIVCPSVSKCIRKAISNNKNMNNTWVESNNLMLLSPLPSTWIIVSMPGCLYQCLSCSSRNATKWQSSLLFVLVKEYNMSRRSGCTVDVYVWIFWCIYKYYPGVTKQLQYSWSAKTRGISMWWMDVTNDIEWWYSSITKHMYILCLHKNTNIKSHHIIQHDLYIPRRYHPTIWFNITYTYPEDMKSYDSTWPIYIYIVYIITNAKSHGSMLRNLKKTPWKRLPFQSPAKGTSSM